MACSSGQAQTSHLPKDLGCPVKLSLVDFLQIGGGRVWQWIAVLGFYCIVLLVQLLTADYTLTIHVSGVEAHA